uniref:S1 motif domain-containing protein n=1 Tax=Erythrolobus australicus TaxID=1077150 RepID=A0A7S1TLV1_9RHOD
MAAAQTVTREDATAAAATAASGGGAGTAGKRNLKSMSKFERMRVKFGTREKSSAGEGAGAGAGEEVGFSYDDLESGIQEYDKSTSLGQRVVGTVVLLDKSGTFVDISAKSSALLPDSELSICEVGGGAAGVVEVGEQREFEIISSEDSNGMVKLSLRRVEMKQCWNRLAQLQTEDATVFALVESVNRGGAMCKVENLRAFIPGSHLSMLADEQLIGTTLPVKFIEVDPEKGRVVLSQRRAAVQTQMNDVVVGQVVTGVVRSIKPFGIFVDLNGLSALLHISQISHDRVEDPAAVVQNGQSIKCMVISADAEKGRISLSTKTLEPQPGDMLKDSQSVFDSADEMAARYHQRLEEERKAAAAVAEDIVSSLDVAGLE